MSIPFANGYKITKDIKAKKNSGGIDDDNGTRLIRKLNNWLLDSGGI